MTPQVMVISVPLCETLHLLQNLKSFQAATNSFIFIDLLINPSDIFLIV